MCYVAICYNVVMTIQRPCPPLFICPVAGVSHQAEYPANLRKYQMDEGVALVRLQRDRGNSHDPHAVCVVGADGVLVGWVPGPIAARLAPELDAGVQWIVTGQEVLSPRRPSTAGHLWGMRITLQRPQTL